MKTSLTKRMAQLALAPAMLLGAAFTAQAGDDDFEPVYTMSNSPSGNEIAVLERDSRGRLRLESTYATGGNGTGIGIGAPFDPLGSTHSLLLSENGRWLFAVNAGSDTVSTFRVRGDRLTLASVTPSAGDYPVSITQRGNLVYVLNASGDGNFTGFRLDNRGRLNPIPGSTRSLNAATPSLGDQPDTLRSPTQVEFSHDGRWLIVVDKNLDTRGTLQLYAVDDDGVPATTPVVTTSNEPAPFGFMIDVRGNILQTELVSGAVTAYSIQRSGNLRTLSASVANGQSATCWIDGNADYAYVSNPLSNTLSGYRINPDGSLRLLNANGVAASLEGDRFPIDLKVSDRGQFLNLVNAGTGSVNTYRIRSNGQLALINELPLYPGLSGMSGIASR